MKQKIDEFLLKIALAFDPKPEIEKLIKSDLNDQLLEDACRKQREACYKEYKEKQSENIIGVVKEAWNIDGGERHDLGKAIHNTPLIKS